MSDTLKRTHAKIANTLGELSPLFEDRCKLTFVMRDPLDEEAYIIVGDDTNEDVIDVLRRVALKQEVKLTSSDLFAAALGLDMPQEVA